MLVAVRDQAKSLSVALAFFDKSRQLGAKDRRQL